VANDALTLGRTMAVGVEATAKNGDVTLTGTVRCAAERAAAEAMIADLTGVRTVTDDIQVRDDANPLHPDTEPMEQL
jgi:osmotically-inducible protein OsmY